MAFLFLNSSLAERCREVGIEVREEGDMFKVNELPSFVEVLEIEGEHLRDYRLNTVSSTSPSPANPTAGKKSEGVGLDLRQLVSRLKPIKGQRVVKWLERFLTAHPDQLDQWSGHFTEVVTAKAIAIYRRRGVVEEYEANVALFGRLVNAAYGAQIYKPEAGIKITASGESQNPFTHERISSLKFLSGEYEEKNKRFFGRLCNFLRGQKIFYYDAGGDGYYDLLGIKGEPKLEAIPVPVFLQVMEIGFGADGNSRRILAKNFFLESNWFELIWQEKDKWNRLSESDTMS